MEIKHDDNDEIKLLSSTKFNFYFPLSFLFFPFSRLNLLIFSSSLQGQAALMILFVC